MRNIMKYNSDLLLELIKFEITQNKITKFGKIKVHITGDKIFFKKKLNDGRHIYEDINTMAILITQYLNSQYLDYTINDIYKTSLIVSLWKPLKELYDKYLLEKEYFNV